MPILKIEGASDPKAGHSKGCQIYDTTCYRFLQDAMFTKCCSNTLANRKSLYDSALTFVVSGG